MDHEQLILVANTAMLEMMEICTESSLPVSKQTTFWRKVSDSQLIFSANVAHISVLKPNEWWWRAWKTSQFVNATETHKEMYGFSFFLFFPDFNELLKLKVSGSNWQIANNFLLNLQMQTISSY